MGIRQGNTFDGGMRGDARAFTQGLKKAARQMRRLERGNVTPPIAAAGNPPPAPPIDRPSAPGDVAAAGDSQHSAD